MPKLFPYDLSHFSFQKGTMGHLKGLSVVPVIAGDRFQGNIEGIWRLSPLRRQLSVDVKVDLFAFYVPHRHIYGETWVDFMKQGIDESQTFPSQNASFPMTGYGPRYEAGDTVPRWISGGYNRIWNRFFRFPGSATVRPELSDTALLNNTHDRENGRGCTWLKTMWSTGIDPEVNTSDWNVPSASNTMSLIEFAQRQARFKTERQREYFSRRYFDVMKNTFGQSISSDAENRPTLIKRDSFWMSGYDVDGTDDAALGQFSGKSVAIGGMNIPGFVFPEHGAMWVLALLRFPTLYEQETHYLAKIGNPSYKDFAGDPAIVANEPPGVISARDVFVQTSSSSSLGTIPFGQHYRYQPSYIDRKYDELNGFAFVTGAPTTFEDAHYVDSTAYNEVFSNRSLGHWNCQLHFSLSAQRVVPPPTSSIFAGTR